MDYLDRRINNLNILGYLLQLAPFVRAVILTGSMTTGSAGKRSDLDLLIITTQKRLYTARLFVTFGATLTGLRRKPDDKRPAGKFCLNYYLTVNDLDIKPHTQRCANFHRYIVNIWDRDGVYERILRENFWLKNFKVVIKNQNNTLLLKKNFPIRRLAILGVFRRIFELLFAGHFGNSIERKLFIWQKQKIISSALYKNNKSTIAVSKNELRLHPQKG